MKYCPNCKLTYDDNANVCGQCGSPLMNGPDQRQVQPQMVVADPTDHTAEFDPKDISDNKVFAMLPYILSFFGIIISLLASSASPYTMFHVRQGLKIMVVEILVYVVGALVPFLGWFLVLPIGSIILFVVQIICFFRVCGGSAKEPPIIKSLGFLK